MYLERLMPGLLGDGNGTDPFSIMYQQGQQAQQQGMQGAQQTAQARANAMQAFNQHEAEQAQKEKAARGLALTIATGGMGAGAGAAAGAAEAGEGILGPNALGAFSQDWEHSPLNPNMQFDFGQLGQMPGYGKPYSYFF